MARSVMGFAFHSAYETFNYVECAAWFVIAAVLPLRLRGSVPPEKRGAVIRAVVTLAAFGLSDFFEARTHGLIPPWLWGWKLLCAACLLKCRYDYIGRERFRWLDRTNILALICLLAVILAMFLLSHFREFIDDGP